MHRACWERTCAARGVVVVVVVVVIVVAALSCSFPLSLLIRVVN